MAIIEARQLAADFSRETLALLTQRQAWGRQKDGISPGECGDDGFVLTLAPSPPSLALLSSAPPDYPLFPPSTSPTQNLPLKVWLPCEASPEPRHQVEAGASCRSSLPLTRAIFVLRRPV